MKLSPCFLGAVLTAVTLQVQASLDFPILNNASSNVYGGAIACDGTNYLTGLATTSALGAQLINATGGKIGSFINVGKALKFPAQFGVAFSGGVYLEAWSDSSVTSGVDMFGQLISPAGKKVGARFNLLSSASGLGFQKLMAVCAGNNEFIVIWQDQGSGSLYDQIITPQGTRSGSPALLSGSQTQIGASAAVAFDGTNFLAAWQADETETGNANSTYAIFADVTGSPLGNIMQLSQTTSLDQNPLAVAFDGAQYMVVWNKDTQLLPNGAPADWMLCGRSVFPYNASFPDGSFPDPLELYFTGGLHNQASFPTLGVNNGTVLMAWSSYSNSLATNHTIQAEYFRLSVPVSSEFTPLPNLGTNQPLIALNGLASGLNQFILLAGYGQLLINASGNITGLQHGQGWGVVLPVDPFTPTAASQPVGDTNLTGVTEALTFNVNGTGLLYQWYKNHSPVTNSARISGANSASLTILNAAVSDSGTYYAVASNIWGTIVSSNATLFIQAPAVITITVSPPGAQTVSGAGSYTPNTSVELKPNLDNDCYHIVNWTVGGKVVSTDPVYIFTATHSEAVVANFVKYTYNVQLSVGSGQGTVSGGGEKPCGTNVTAKAVPANGYIFSNWSVPGGTPVSTLPTDEFTAESDVVLFANFIPGYTVTVSSSPPGHADVSGGGSYPSGTPADLDVKPYGCYVFKNWTQGTKVVSTSANFNYTGNSNATFVANFEQITYSVTASANVAGWGTVSGGGLSEGCGNTVTLTAKANPGFKFGGWYIPGNGPVSQNNPYSFMVNGPTSLIASFQDSVPPTLTVTSPIGTTTTTSENVTITGTATDNVGVDQVNYVNDSLGTFQAQLTHPGARSTGWSVTGPLDIGTNHIQLSAADGMNYSAITTVTVIRKYVPESTTFPVAVGPIIEHPQSQAAFDGINYLVVFQTYDDTTNNSAATGQFMSQAGDLVGGELALNPGGSDDPPTVAFDGANYLAAWADYSDSQNAGVPLKGAFVGTDGSVGSVFQLSQSTSLVNFQTMVFGGGVYFALWDDGQVGNDGILGVMIDPSGAVVASDFVLSDNGKLNEAGQATAAFDGTNFLATWGFATNGAGILAQLVSPSGALVGNPITVFHNPSGSGKSLMCVTFDGTKYLVLFNAVGTTAATSTWHVEGRFVTPGGEVMAKQISLTTDAGPQIIPGAAFGDGRYLVTWNQGFDPFTISTTGSVKARELDINGNSISEEFTLFAQQGKKIALWAPVLYDGTRFFSTAGSGTMTAASPGLRFNNAIISGAFITP